MVKNYKEYKVAYKVSGIIKLKNGNKQMVKSKDNRHGIPCHPRKERDIHGNVC